MRTFGSLKNMNKYCLHRLISHSIAVSWQNSTESQVYYVIQGVNFHIYCFVL